MATPKFALVYTQDPPAVDVLKENEFEDQGGPFEVNALRDVKKPSWAACKGRIISIGTHKMMASLRVNIHGEIMDANFENPLKNRFQELAKKKKSENDSAKEIYLREISENLLRAGPGGITSHSSTLRLPKKRPAENLEGLKMQLGQLRCLTRHEGDVKLSLEHDVFMGGAQLLMLQNLHCSEPTLLLAGLLGKLVPDEVASQPGLTRTGSRDTVQLPEKIVEAANVSVLTFFKDRKIAVDYSNYKVAQIVRNFLYYKQHPKRNKGTQEAHGEAEEREEVETEPRTETEPPASVHADVNQVVVERVTEAVNEEEMLGWPSPVQPIIIDNNNNNDGIFLKPTRTSHIQNIGGYSC